MSMFTSSFPSQFSLSTWPIASPRPQISLLSLAQPPPPPPHTRTPRSNTQKQPFHHLPFSQQADGGRPHDSTEQLRNLLLMQQGTRDQMASLDAKPRYQEPAPSAAAQYGAPPRQDFSQPPADFNKFPSSAQGYGAAPQQERYTPPNVALS